MLLVTIMGFMKAFFKWFISVVNIFFLRTKYGTSIAHSKLFRIAINSTKGNRIYFNNAILSKTDILIRGKGNILQLVGQKNSCIEISNTTFRIVGENCRITISEGAKLNKAQIVLQGNSCSITIGGKTTLGSGMIVCMGIHNYIKIGNECMFADNIDIWATDSHPIFDRSSNQILNSSKPIIIKNHVWLGKNTTVLKGTILEEGTVVGMNSTVTKSTKPYNLVAGYPARLLRENISWNRNFIES